jgi:hypothetical protein
MDWLNRLSANTALAERTNVNKEPSALRSLMTWSPL